MNRDLHVAAKAITCPKHTGPPVTLNIRLIPACLFKHSKGQAGRTDGKLENSSCASTMKTQARCVTLATITEPLPTFQLLRREWTNRSLDLSKPVETLERRLRRQRDASSPLFAYMYYSLRWHGFSSLEKAEEESLKVTR